MFTYKRFCLVLLACVLALVTAVAVVGARTSTAADTYPVVGGDLDISALDANEFLPAVAYNWKHHEYLIVWHATWTNGARDIRAVRLSAGGHKLGTYSIFEHPTKGSAQPAVAYDPVHDRYLVTWAHDVSGAGDNWDIFGRFIPWDGPAAPLPPFPICTWGTNQWVPTVAYARAVEEFLVAWSNEYQNGALPWYISARRVTAGGGFPGSDSDVTINHATDDRLRPDLTYNLARNEYLLVYDDTADIFGMRLTGHLDHDFGGEFGIAGWPAMESEAAVAACREADQYLVTWQSNQDIGNNAIYGRFLNGAAVPGNVHKLADVTSSDQTATVACNQAGRQYLVAWQTEYTNLKFGVWARLIQTDETLAPDFPIMPPGSSAERTRAAIGGGGANYLVAWEHERDGGTPQDIHGRLVAPFGQYIPINLSGN